jgi:general secretion pathway protein M
MIANLSQREKVILALGAAVVLATLLFLGVIDPYRGAMVRLDSQISSRQRQLQKIHVLRGEYLALQRQQAQVDARMARGKDFSLFSFVENVTGQVASKENLVYMRPQPSSVQDTVREDSVEIKLEKIRLNQLVRLLYAIDSADACLQVKSLRVKTRFDDRTLLDAVLTISSFGRNA